MNETTGRVRARGVKYTKAGKAQGASAEAAAITSGKASL